MSQGNLVSWETAEWSVANMTEESLTTEQMCKPLRPGHVLFPERRNMTSAIDICHKMKAQVSVVDSASMVDELVRKYDKVLGVDEPFRCMLQLSLNFTMKYTIVCNCS